MTTKCIMGFINSYYDTNFHGVLMNFMDGGMSGIPQRKDGSAVCAEINSKTSEYAPNWVEYSFIQHKN